MTALKYRDLVMLIEIHYRVNNETARKMLDAYLASESAV